MKRQFTFLACLLCVNALSAQSAMATLFGIESCGSGSSDCDAASRFVRGGGSMPPSYLYSLEASGAGFVNHGVITSSGSAVDTDGLAIDSGGSLFAFEFEQSITTTPTAHEVNVVSSRLVTINSSTAEATVIGVDLDREIRGAVFDELDNLWVVDSRHDEVLRIDTSTGQEVAGSAVSLSRSGSSFDISTITDLAIRSDGSVYISEVSRIFELDLATGVMSNAFSTGNDGFAGIAFEGASVFGFDVLGTDDIFSYDASMASSVRSDVLIDFLPTLNAGRGDLASITRVSTPIPEPGTMLLMTLGAAGFYVTASRRRFRGCLNSSC